MFTFNIRLWELQKFISIPYIYYLITFRSFGRFTLVGTHTINSIHKFLHTRTPATTQHQNMDSVRNAANIRREASGRQLQRLDGGRLNYAGNGA